MNGISREETASSSNPSAHVASATETVSGAPSAEKMAEVMGALHRNGLILTPEEAAADARAVEPSAAHTPGPWEIGDDGPILYDGMLRPVWNIYGGTGWHHQLVGSAEHFPDDEYPNANARLIAAAPAMYEALKAIRAWLLDSGQLVDDGISHPAFVKANNAANAAIAAAEGRS